MGLLQEKKNILYLTCNFLFMFNNIQLCTSFNFFTISVSKSLTTIVINNVNKNKESCPFIYMILTHRAVSSSIKTLPDNVWWRKCSQQSHWQTKAKVIWPVSLNIGQSLVHLNTLIKQKMATLSQVFHSNRNSFLLSDLSASHHG